jgi:hypothetical protein
MAQLIWRLIVGINFWLAITALAALPLSKRLENHASLEIIPPLTL